MPHYLALSAFYGLFFAALGVWLPFWPLYLKEIGFEAQAIGLAAALGQGIKVLGPPLWGHLADRGSRHRVT
ncbi:MAG: MFS transporter, partial [Magnetococcales bacterium]|nr:MFS transporter [Magnetococcales bacterium]